LLSYTLLFKSLGSKVFLDAFILQGCIKLILSDSRDIVMLQKISISNKWCS